MLTHLTLLVISLMALMTQHASADITLKLTTRLGQSASNPRTFGTGRSRPRRQDSVFDPTSAPLSRDLATTAHQPMPLNNKDSKGVLYTVDVEVAGVSLPVLIDTGSSQFWVASQDCPTCSATDMSGAPIPTPPTCVNTTMYYLQGQVSGCMTAQDIVVGSYRLPAQEVVAARELTGAFASQVLSMSGIFGVGRASGNQIFGIPPVLKLYNTGQISSPTVGFYLNRNWESGDTGELTFGDVTKSGHVDTTKSVRLPSTGDRLGMYHVQMDVMKSGAAILMSGRTVIIDTGSTNLMVPENLLPGVYRTLTTDQKAPIQDGSYMIPCIKDSGVYDLVLTFGGQDWRVDYQDIVGAEVSNTPGYCWGRITATEGSDKSLTWIGSVFLKSVYTAFDVSNGSVNFYGLK